VGESHLYDAMFCSTIGEEKVADAVLTAMASSERTEYQTADPQVNPWIIAISVMFGTFMEVLDTTVVNVSLPHIAGSLHRQWTKPPGRSPPTWSPMPSFCR